MSKFQVAPRFRNTEFREKKAMTDWDIITNNLMAKGFARIPGVFSEEECNAIRAQYMESSLYRSVISMERYRFGKGEYKYFAYPLPDKIQTVRESLYETLFQTANTSMGLVDAGIEYPSNHTEFLRDCTTKGQQRPTPLILKYGPGGYNTLHQDLYGEVFFPFQVVILLSKPEEEFEGGEFVIVEQIPRAQSKATVIKLNKGDGLVFTTNFRPVKGVRGYYRASMKHGLSEVTAGERFALGIIFHDAV
jgi:uncharacterized protein